MTITPMWCAACGVLRDLSKYFGYNTNYAESVR